MTKKLYIAGTRTQAQELRFANALKLAGDDVNAIGVLEIANAYDVEDIYCRRNRVARKTTNDSVTFGFADSLIGHITIAGDCLDPEFILLHEIGHIISYDTNGDCSEEAANAYAERKLGRCFDQSIS